MIDTLQAMGIDVWQKRVGPEEILLQNILYYFRQETLDNTLKIDLYQLLQNPQLKRQVMRDFRGRTV